MTCNIRVGNGTCTLNAGHNGSHRRHPPKQPQPARDGDPRPVKVSVSITGRDGKTTTYRLAATTAEEERTKVHGRTHDIRFTFNDVEYRT